MPGRHAGLQQVNNISGFCAKIHLIYLPKKNRGDGSFVWDKGTHLTD